MEAKLYYTPPADHLFDEVRAKSIELWREVANNQSYMQEKVSAIEKIANVQDNFMYMVAMFDGRNQSRLADRLSEEARTGVCQDS